jgi:regulator of replication initiation timing
MLQIKVNGRPLKSYSITQDENGPYHKGLRALVQMGGGMQFALDFGNMRAGYKITANQDCKVITRGSNYGNYVAVDFGTHQVCFVHVYKHGSGTIKAGQQICQIAPRQHNGGYAVHLHVYGKKNYKDYKIRNLIFAKIKNPYKIGEWVELTSDTNLRKEPAGHKMALEKKGDKFKITAGPVEKNMVGKTYTWYQGVNTKLDVFWFFDGNIKKVKAPDTFDAEKYLKQIRKLEAELKEMSDMLDALRESNEQLLAENEKLQNDKLAAIDMYKKVKRQREKTQKALEATQKTLKECNKGCDAKVANARRQRLATLLRERPVGEQVQIVLDNLLNNIFKQNS